MKLAKFLHVHLVSGGWYLDCSRGFVPKVEEILYNNIVSFAAEVIELEKKLKEDNLVLPSNKKEVVSVKDKG